MRQRIGELGHRRSQVQRVAVRVGGNDQVFQHLILVHLLGGDVGHHRGAVGIADADRHTDDGGLGGTRAIAVVGGGEGRRVFAGLGIAGRPAEQRRFRVERCAGGQAAGRVGHARQAALERGELTIRHPVLRLEARVIRVEGEGSERQRLAFQGNPGTQFVELRCAIDVQYRQLDFHVRSAIAVADLEVEVVDARVVERRHPGEFTGVGVEPATGWQDGAVVGQRIALGVGGIQHQAERIALADDAVGYVAQGGGLIALLNRQGEAVGGAMQAITDVQRDVLVNTGGVVIGQPLQGLAIDVEYGACGQVVGVVHQMLTLWIFGNQGQ